MGSPMVDYCEQANPKILTDIRNINSEVGKTRRVQASFLAAGEKKTLLWLAERTPAGINSDHLTALGFAGQLAAGVFYALSRWNRYYLLAVIACLIVNWLGDSLDGTLARVGWRNREAAGARRRHDDWLGSIGVYASVDRDGAAARFSGAIDPVLSCDLYAGRISAFLLEFWSDRTSLATGGWQSGFAAMARGVASPVSAIRYRRSDRAGRDDLDGDLFHHKECVSPLL